ncbi:single-stranded-DNA-specific exonuclease RecJ [Celerinatantimonas yamalensis]|uniref:Single-stranded-DNA-specific exonuclease RecJ n=1 Tax=Celerinatantimonas yamalensis TaxID=559956 RepID=A0ABW9G9M8_9GAMM
MTHIRLVRRPPADITLLPKQLPEKIRQIYACRGVSEGGELTRGLAQLVSWQKLTDMTTAVELLLRYQHQSIMIVGDFDCDGATSTALMLRGLRSMGFSHVDFLVPNRFEYGYGLSPEIVDVAHARGAQLIVTVDNGISSITGVEQAIHYGIEVIVTDHHLPAATLPKAAAIINPNLSDCDFPSKHLAGVGVAFYLLCALRAKMREQHLFAKLQLAEPNLAEYLDLVALGTVADVVSLDHNNRVLVYQGLARIRSGMCCAGIQALIEVSGRNQGSLAASDLGFALGPRLNAVGRLDDMSLGINTLLCDDLYQARQMASTMDELNQERKSIEASMQQEAQAHVAKLSIDQQVLPHALALYCDDWHQGVVGLVASRIKEKYYRPVFAFADADELTLKGSGRSVAGVHMRDLLERIDTLNPGLIDKFGGHAMAAGLSIAKAKFAQFVEQLERVALDLIDETTLTGELLSDGELLASDLTLTFAEQLREAGPWGQGFEEPIFDGLFWLLEQRIVGQNHLKMTVQPLQGGPTLDAIAFNVDRKSWPDHQARQVQLAYKLDVNEFRGRRSAQLLVEWLAKTEPEPAQQ